MAISTIAIDEPGVVDKLLDTWSLSNGTDTVEREIMRLGGATINDLAPVTAADGLTVNLGTNNDVTVSGVATEAKQDTIISHIDGIEAVLATIDADTGAIATSVASIDTKASTIIGHVDGIEALLTTIDADTSNISTKIDTLAGAVSGSEMQVDVVTSALPTGAATSANQSTIISAIDGIEGSVDGIEGLLTTIDADTSVLVTGASPFYSLDIDESEEQVKGSAGVLYNIYFTNRTTSPLYLKFYNDTAANVTVGSTTPHFTVELPANATDHIAGNVQLPASGIAFGTAITVACTTGLADNDTGAPGANHCAIFLGYK